MIETDFTDFENDDLDEAMNDLADSSNSADTGTARTQLRSIVERIERLEEEKKGISDDIKDVYSEAKSNGFDTKVLRNLIRLRKLDKNERMNQEAILDTYMVALGMAPDFEKEND